MRADSIVDAHRKMMRAWNSIACLVCPSITRTPVARPRRLSYVMLWTTLYGRSVRRPVACAAGSVALTLEKYERVMQPRWHGPQ